MKKPSSAGGRPPKSEAERLTKQTFTIHPTHASWLRRAAAKEGHNNQSLILRRLINAAYERRHAK